MTLGMNSQGQVGKERKREENRATQVPSAQRVSTCVLIYAMVFTCFFFNFFSSIQYMLQENSSNMYSYLFKAATVSSGQ